MELTIERLEERIAPGLIVVATGDILSDNFSNNHLDFWSHNEKDQCCEKDCEKEKEKEYDRCAA